MMLALCTPVTLFRDDLQALDDAWNDLVLEPRVQVFGVLAHDHQVDACEARRHPGQIEDRAQVGKKVQRLAEANVHAGEPVADGGRDGTLQGDAVSADRVQQLGGKRRARALDGGRACIVPLPLCVEAGLVEDAQHRVGDFRTDAVAGDQGDGPRHSVSGRGPG
jgi:hypothetical protein